MERKVWSEANYEFQPAAPLPTDDIVDREGYRDTQTMVEEMTNAGALLNAIRRDEVYEYEENQNVGEEELDPTRAQGFDVIDAQRLAEKANANIKAALDKDAAEKKAKEEADAKAAKEKAEADAAELAAFRAKAVKDGSS